MTVKVRTYVFSVAAAAALVSLMLYRESPAIAPSQLGAVLVMGALGVFADLLVYQLPRGAAGSVSFIPFLAAAVLGPTWHSLAAVSGAQLIAELLRRKSALKTIFNLSQVSFSVAAGILVYRALGGVPLLSETSVSLASAAAQVAIPGLGLVLVYFGSNSLLVTGAVALSENRRYLDVIRQNTLGTILY
ncbi:MAG TPA: hypothetical protein VJ672_16605, partial [Gemmatimonadaceae bacterium]|nr:hypothetical protein [Gemmatimonadaceae bacterium]